MEAIKGFAYYNSDAIAGSSQRHKHFQAIPYSSLPSNLLFKEIDAHANDGKFPYYEFKHFIYQFDQEVSLKPEMNLNDVKLFSVKAVEGFYKCKEVLGNINSYNIILTKKWMLMVPRKLSDYKGIGINAMGFTGSLFIKKEEESIISDMEPLEILKSVCYPLDAK